MKKISLFLMIIIAGLQLQAQNLEEEVGYLYTKAKYLLETDRSSEAIDIFTQIIKKDAHFKDAMALRARAKYKTGKNKKAKKDILRFIEENGLTPGAVKTLALINYADKDYDVAANSLYTASLIFPRDVELLEKRAEVLAKNGESSEACIAWHDAAKLGSKIAKKRISIDCEGNSSPPNTDTEPDKTTVEDPVVVEQDDNDKEVEKDKSEGKTDNQEKTNKDEDENIDKEKNVEVEEEKEEVYDITDIDLNEGPNKRLKLDEELFVNILGGGLGNRKVKRMPNILLLTDVKGTIVVDLCVSKNGDILAAELNTKESTMHHKSNSDYILRKTKDLKFDKFDETKCGRIIYNVNL